MPTQRTPSRAFVICIAVVLSIAAVVVWFAPSSRQYRSMKAASFHIATSLSPLRLDPRFTQVEFVATTSENISIFGRLPDAAAFEELHQFVLKSRPPCPVRYQLEAPLATEPDSSTLSTDWFSASDP